MLLEITAERGSSEEAVETAVGAARLAHEAKLDRLLLTLDPAAVPELLPGMRSLAARLRVAGAETPLVLLDRPGERSADTLLGPSLALGGLLCEGIGDSILVETGSADDSRRLEPVGSVCHRS